MKKKVDWKDKELIEGALTQSNSYSDTLRALGLKAVSANTVTLKKYIKHHGLSSDHFDEASSFHRKKGIVTETKEPHVEIIGDGIDPKKGIKMELDWNDAFIDYLKANGYKGTDEETIVQLWITHLYQNMMESMANDDTSEFAG